MNVPSEQAKALFLEATEGHAPEEWPAFLDRACAGEPELRAGVERLLRARAELGSFHENAGPLLGATIDVPVSECPGTVIGPYKLLQQIGEGGMGTVYMAEQTEPVKRKVALKLIKPGMDSRQVIARFEAERQALAMMDHVNIARVFDGGTTENGRPYFVMELVHGVPITKYCDDNHLTPRQRLELFVPVCQAIQHAHQKGIIHRDIKPSNVMVTLYDGKPVPKVIDFGVAKATEQKLTERTLFTQYGTMVGTLEYMSPEQAEMSALGVDTRSDIYSLGVLLYELLTGSTPLTHKRMKEAAYGEILRMIKEEEPPRPSTRLSDSGQALASISANRHTEPAKLTKLVRGELDWIVMKTLEKDRSRRYETANGLAQDVQCYLADETVQACPPSVGYLLRKFLRRNQGPVLAAAVIVVALVGGIIGTAWGLIRAQEAWKAEAERAEGQRLAKIEAETEKTKALASAEAEKKANAQAQLRLAQIEKGNDIITSIFNDLDIRQVRAGTEPLEAILAKRLVKAGELLESQAVGDPLVVARLQNRLGVALVNLGHEQEAIPLFVKARATLGVDHPDTLNIMNNLAVGYRAAGQLELSLPLFDETLKLKKAKLGADHPSTLTSMTNLAEGYQAAGQLVLALRLSKETLELKQAKLGADHPSTLTSMNNLASSYQAAGQAQLALSLWEETLKLTKARLGPDHPDTLTNMNNLADGYRAAGQLGLALRLSKETLELKKAKLGAEHSSTLTSMNILASCYQDAGQPELAISLSEETLKLRKIKPGADHPDTLTSMAYLASSYQVAGRLDLALPLSKETLRLRKAKLGADHPDTLTSMGSLAAVYQVAGQLDLALPLSEETLRLRKAKLGADHPETLNSMNSLATAYRAAGRLALALRLYEETLNKAKVKLGADHPHTLTIMGNLASSYNAAERLDLGLPLMEETLKLRKAKLGVDHPNTLTSMNNLAEAYQAAGQLELAMPLLGETFKLRQARLGDDHPSTLMSMNNLATGYLAAGKLDLARPLLQGAAVSIEKGRYQHEHAGQIINNLIVCQEELKQFDQAESWRRKWLAQVKERAGTDSLPYAAQLAALGLNLLLQKNWTDAEVVLRECLAVRGEKAADEWWTFNTKSSLGSALLGQKKYAEAEPLLVAGYEGLKQREAKIPVRFKKVRLEEALERLVQLYQGLDKKDEAAKWQKLLEEAKAAKPKGKSKG